MRETLAEFNLCITDFGNEVLPGPGWGRWSWWCGDESPVVYANFFLYSEWCCRLKNMFLVVITANNVTLSPRQLSYSRKRLCIPAVTIGNETLNAEPLHFWDDASMLPSTPVNSDAFLWGLFNICCIFEMAHFAWYQQRYSNRSAYSTLSLLFSMTSSAQNRAWKSRAVSVPFPGIWELCCCTADGFNQNRYKQHPCLFALQLIYFRSLEASLSSS